MVTPRSHAFLVTARETGGHHAARPGKDGPRSGRRRQFSSAQERARIAARKAIAAALDRIGQHDSSLARQLRDSVRTGGACRYDPDPGRPVNWILDG